MTRPQDRLGPVVRLAPAKLNLTLSVVGRRSDGFHELHSIMAPLELADRLSLAVGAGSADQLHVVGADGRPLDAGAYDSVPQAIAEARRTTGRGAETVPLAARLEKRIPMAAGLAGGSSDAAAALQAALEAWGAELDPADLAAAAARVGSDVPFFLAGGIALVQGRGEEVTRLTGIRGAPPGVLLVTPATPSSTTAAFAALDAGGHAAPTDPHSTRLTSEHLAAELAAGLAAADLARRAGVLATANDLIAAAEAQVPGLRATRMALRRLLGVPIGLTGSGPTLWAIYPSPDEAREAERRVTAALAAGTLVVPGTGSPFVGATMIVSSPNEPHAGRDAR